MHELGLGISFEGIDAGALNLMSRVSRGLLDTVGSASQAGKAIKAYFKEFGVGMALFGAGVAGLAALSPALEETKQFGKAIALVATETDLAVFSQEKMREVTMQLGTQFGKLPKEEATALYEAVGMGANNAAKATYLMTGANRLAVAGNADLKTTIDALGGAMRAYGADWSQANDYADTMFVAMTSGKTTVGELAASLGHITSMSASLGLTFEETTAAISAMTSTGIEANNAVTGLHGAFANILHPATEAKAEAARLGIHFDTLTLKSKGLMGFLQMIASARGFKGVETLKHLFPSVEGFNAVMQITAGNMQGFKDALGAMGDKAGAAKKGFDILSQTAAFQEDRFKALKSTALILIGQALEPMAAAVMGFGNAILEAFNKIPAPIRDFLVKAFALVSVFLTVVGGAIAVKAAIGLVGAGLSALGVSFAGVLAAAWPVVAVLAALALAVVAFRYAYEHNLGGFATFVDNVYSKVSLFFRALGQLFESGGFSGAVLEELDAGNQGVENFAIKVWGAVQRVKHFFESLAEGFGKGLDAAAPAFHAFVESLTHLGVAMGFITEKGDAASNLKTWETIGKVGAVIGQGLAEVIGVVVRVIAFVVDAYATWIEVNQALEAAGQAAGAAVVSAFVWIKTTAISVYDAVAAGFAKVYDFFARLAAIAGVVADLVGIVVGAIWNKIVGAIAPYIQRAVAFFTPYVDAVSAAFDAVGAAISGALSSAFDAVSSAASSVVGAIVSRMMPVVTVMVGVGRAIYDAWSDVWGRIMGVVEGVIERIRSAIQSILSKIGAVFNAIRGVTGSVGAGLWAGAGEVASGALTGAEKSLGIEGQFAAHGNQIMDIAAPYLPGGTPASAAAASGAGGPTDPAAVGGAVASALASAPLEVSVAPAKTVITLDGQTIADVVTERQRSSGQSAEVPMSIAR